MNQLEKEYAELDRLCNNILCCNPCKYQTCFFCMKASDNIDIGFFSNFNNSGWVVLINKIIYRPTKEESIYLLLKYPALYRLYKYPKGHRVSYKRSLK